MNGLIRRVNPALIAQELLKVQPMTLPSGLVFYLDYTYGQPSCAVEGHEAFGKPLAECEHPDCQARMVMES